MKKIYIIISLLSGTLKPEMVELNTSVSTLVELRNNYYKCVYDTTAQRVLCTRNQTASLSLPLTITFRAKDGVHTTCFLVSYDDSELVGTYKSKNGICSVSVKKMNQLDQTTYDEWTQSYQEE